MLYLSDVLTYLLNNTNDAQTREIEELNQKIEDLENKVKVLEDKIASN